MDIESSHKIQWYPGHIAKMERKLGESLKLVDVVIEVVDARLPQATVNPRLASRYGQKPVLVLLNKADLAEPAQNSAWLRVLKRQRGAAKLYESLSGKGRKELIDAIIKLGEPVMQKLEAKGMRRRPIRVLVVGMPNVGKSTIINSIVQKKKAKTGHKAGVTRQTQWVRIHEAVELLDTPGIIPPVLESELSGLLLAAVSGVGEAAFDEETAANFLMARVEALYPGKLASVYKWAAQTPLTLESVAQSRHYVVGGGQPDIPRTARAVLTDFRQGRWGRMTLEHAETPSNQAAQPTQHVVSPAANQPTSVPD